jgi:Histidine kinase-, DNA gyrase B-, and HSP90-like ATPase
MIIDNNRTATQTDGVISESFFNIKQENVAHVFSILRNNLYSNKPLAIIREYCTNAQDAMVDAGKGDQPITVSMPTYFNSTLSIRDYGNGLCEDDIYNTFASYGESTKRATNDMVGMLGLGSKSAFSYAENFIVISRNENVKKTYSAYIDDTGIGKISKIAEEPCDDSGLEIQVTIRKEDINQFDQHAKIFLSEFSPTPNILNNTSLEGYLASEKPVIVAGTNWVIRKRSNYGNDHYVKMGNVCYPFSRSNIGFNDDLYQFVNRFPTSQTIYLNANIGDVNFTISRESLEFTEKTKTFLVNALVTLSEELALKAEEIVNNASTYWDAMVAYFECSSIFKSHRDSVSFVVDGKTFNGEYFDLSKLPVSIRRKYVNGKWETVSYVKPERNLTFYVFKGNCSRKSIFIRAKSHIEENNIPNAHLIGFDNEAKADAWLAEGWIAGANIVDVSTIPYQHFKKDRAKSQVAKSEVYKLVNYTSKGTPNNARWVAVDESVLEAEEGVYMPIKYFKPVNTKLNNKSMEEFELIEQITRGLRNLDVEIPTIYGIRANDAQNLTNGWMTFDDFVQNELDALPEEWLNRLIASDMAMKFQFYFYANFHLLENDPTNIGEKMKPYNDVTLLPYKMVGQFLNSLGYNVDLSLSEEVNKMIEEARKKYPLLSYLQSSALPSGCYKELNKYLNS